MSSITQEEVFKIISENVQDEETQELLKEIFRNFLLTGGATLIGALAGGSRGAAMGFLGGSVVSSIASQAAKGSIDYGKVISDAMMIFELIQLIMDKPSPSNALTY